MSSGGFSFPPPPPPPPPQAGPPSFPGHAPTTPYNQNQRGRGAGGYQRGRGRGNAHRSGRGNHMGGPSHGPPHNMNFTPASGNRYGARSHPHPHTPPNHPSPEYNQQGPPVHYAPPQSQPNYPSVPPYAQPPSHLPPPQNAYSQPVPIQYPSRHPAPHPAAYNPPAPMHRHAPSPNHHPQPHVMPPPMRWGFENAIQSSPYPAPNLRAPKYGGYPDMRDSKPPHHPPRQSHDRHGSRPSQEYNSFPSTNQFNRGDKFANRANKRPYSNAFGGPQASSTRPTAPLPVPSFGSSLPSKPPPSVDATKKHRKKKRKYNQLGLTPQTEEHESSEEEDDVDEETKLSQTITTGELKFSYKGQTSTLQTPTDIATWIEERKKRYPTRARVEERLKEAEEKKQAVKEAREAKRAKENALRQQKYADQEEARRLQEARMKKEKDKLDRKLLKEEQQQSLDPTDAAAKAKLKAEKLRRKLMKEEKRVARAEAHAEKARLRAEASKIQTNGTLEGKTNADTTSSSAAEHVPTPTDSDTSKPALTAAEGTQADDQLAIREPQQEPPASKLEHICPIDESQAPITEHVANNVEPKAPETTGTIEHTPQVNGHTSPPGVTSNNLSSDLEVSDSLSSPSEDDSDLDDETTSSGSDSSSGDDDDSTSSEPEQATIRREQPDRVLPPARQQKSLCRQFAKTGQCRRGNRCKFLHEASDKTKAAARLSASTQDKKGKKSLFQALVSREKEEEDRRVMQAISWLGQRGVLDEPATDAAQEVHEEPPPAT
ncbi:CCCH zinc finger protein [Blastomyces gilchristii SLH14081]|uniref:CCCH zinc finger protein n=1 Tax=Blastomyces gilchristii (strain SLH14081) TaxID=559298 RepID=A0A179UPC5_BLAGS|nr:CCCH zinc finger protein [Blastomyces gilchristii SLH14081]OAT08252.1 CCCH zinc finger protein [Blastomyces gilchristii SLH14081]